ncbi:MAG: sulfite exporter TauE/SafE family protein [Candidatus Limnocylindria bacterium]
MIDGPPLVIVGMAVIVFLAGMSTGTTGLGFAQLSAVGLAFVVDAKSAVILLAITVPPVSTVQLLRHRSSMGEWRSRMAVLFACCLIGVPIGAFLLTVLPVRIIALLLGMFTLAFVVTRLRRPTFGIGPRHERLIAPLVGVTAGIFNGTIGVSGPVLGSYLIAIGVSAATFAFTIQTLFLTMTLVRLGGLVALGEINSPLLLTGGLLLVPALTGQSAGFWLQGRVSERGFERAVLVVMAIAGVGLLLRGIAPGA